MRQSIVLYRGSKRDEARDMAHDARAVGLSRVRVYRVRSGWVVTAAAVGDVL